MFLLKADHVPGDYNFDPLNLAPQSDAGTTNPLSPHHFITAVKADSYIYIITRLIRRAFSLTLTTTV